jgi:hypothetical protein
MFGTVTEIGLVANNFGYIAVRLGDRDATYSLPFAQHGFGMADFVEFDLDPVSGWAVNLRRALLVPSYAAGQLTGVTPHSYDPVLDALIQAARR